MNRKSAKRTITSSVDRAVAEREKEIEKKFYREFELDAIAHSQGKCSYPSTASCSAEEQRIKLFISSILASEIYLTLENIHEFAADERDKAGENYNEINDEYKEGYWIAMDTVMKKIESEFRELDQCPVQHKSQDTSSR